MGDSIDFNNKDRKRIKLHLLGFCGHESVKSFSEVVAAFMPLDYEGAVRDLEEKAREVIARGSLRYKGDKYLVFYRISNDELDEERYRISLVDVSKGWEIH